jgi:hypothetical protein
MARVVSHSEGPAPRRTVAARGLGLAVVFILALGSRPLTRAGPIVDRIRSFGVHPMRRRLASRPRRPVP